MSEHDDIDEVALNVLLAEDVSPFVAVAASIQDREAAPCQPSWTIVVLTTAVVTVFLFFAVRISLTAVQAGSNELHSHLAMRLARRG
jgi:hypothetical protein